MHGVKSFKVITVWFVLRETAIYLSSFNDNNTIKRLESVQRIKHRLYLVRDNYLWTVQECRTPFCRRIELPRWAWLLASAWMKKFLGGEEESTDRSLGEPAPPTSFYITDKAYNMAVSRIDDHHFNSLSCYVTKNKVYKEYA